MTPAGVPPERLPGGRALVRLFVRHPTAGNLLMALMVILGLFALARLNTQFFPDFGIDVVSVTVEWPGAAAEDVDANIVEAIEPEVRFLDGIKRVRSTSVEGRATISVEFEPGTDMQQALADVETAVGQVTTLPEDSERPEIRRIVRYEPIVRLVISGPFSEGALKAVAKRIRDDLLNRGVDRVDMFGARDDEIWVEVEPETLQRLDLTLAEIAERIRQSSQDLPSGDTGGDAVRQIRSLGLERDAAGLGGIEIRALDTGEKIHLRDIARVVDAFDEDGRTAKRRGRPAIELSIKRSTKADALEMADTVSAYLDEIGPTLPPGLELEQYDIQANLIRSRIDLLLRNGLSGLVLVVAILFVFLNTRVAFWVAIGIPVSMLATLAIMLASGQSINMVSLFGLIMAIGIVVDDAIVVGEHAETRFRSGDAPLEAAEQGAARMAAPVVSASLTTIAAFLPLFVISGIIGQIIKAIPLVVVAVIVASLVECFFVLPTHMRSAVGHAPSRARRWFNRGFDRFREGPYRRLVTLAVEWRYATLAAAIGLLVVAAGLVIGGRIGFVFFVAPEGDRVFANVQLAVGMPRDRTEAMLDEMERALNAAARKLTEGTPDTAEDLIVMSLAKIGSTTGANEQLLRGGDHLGGLSVELKPSDERTVRTDELIAAWREEIRPLPGLETLTIRPATAGPPGREVDIRLAGRDLAALKETANEVKAMLARYPGVTDIEDDLPYGKEEIILRVTPRGRALGFETATVGRQVRDAFEGAIAKRFPRGDEEVTVRVRLSREARDAMPLEDLYLRAPDGTEVALPEVVSIGTKQGFARLSREDGRREVAITAELDEARINTDKVIAALERDGIRRLAADRGLTVRYAGKAEEQAETFADMRAGAIVGLSAIYIILAWVFASYTRPLVVMSVIPLGFIGVAFGHYLLGYDLTILSMIAIIGLSGIVVNDSIILVSTIKERHERGEPARQAIIDGATDRLRAVFLTSATTIGGLTPLLFETSLQAQFLIPMALTIVFGLMVTTFLVLLVVPALLAVQGGFAALRARLCGRPAAA